MAEFTIDPDQLITASGTLAESASSMVTDLQALQATISGAGSPWGGDDAGTLFGTLYVIVLNKAFETMAERVTQVGQAAQGLSVTAQAFTGTEQGVKTGLQSFAKAV